MWHKIGTRVYVLGDSFHSLLTYDFVTMFFVTGSSGSLQEFELTLIDALSIDTNTEPSLVLYRVEIARRCYTSSAVPPRPAGGAARARGARLARARPRAAPASTEPTRARALRLRSYFLEFLLM